MTIRINKEKQKDISGAIISVNMSTVDFLKLGGVCGLNIIILSSIIVCMPMKWTNWGIVDETHIYQVFVSAY